MSRRLALVAVALLALAAAGGALAPAFGHGSADPVRLDAIVGTNDGFDISLNDTSGLVGQLEAGTYTIVVHDRSRLHNFHLASNGDPGVDFRTDVEFVGDVTFTVTFKAGVRYVYACEPHFQTMFGSFLVTAGAPPPTTTTPSSPPPTRLSAAVSAAGTTSLTPRMIRRGRAAITVRDRSTRRNFHLVGPGFNRRTGRAFRGTTTWRVRLAPGIYRFGTDPGRLTKTLHVH